MTLTLLRDEGSSATQETEKAGEPKSIGTVTDIRGSRFSAIERVAGGYVVMNARGNPAFLEDTKIKTSVR